MKNSKKKNSPLLLFLALSVEVAVRKQKKKNKTKHKNRCHSPELLFKYVLCTLPMGDVKGTSSVMQERNRLKYVGNWLKII